MARGGRREGRGGRRLGRDQRGEAGQQLGRDRLEGQVEGRQGDWVGKVQVALYPRRQLPVAPRVGRTHEDPDVVEDDGRREPALRE